MTEKTSYDLVSKGVEIVSSLKESGYTYPEIMAVLGVAQFYAMNEPMHYASRMIEELRKERDLPPPAKDAEVGVYKPNERERKEEARR